MPVIKSQLDTDSEVFQSNVKHIKALTEDLKLAIRSANEGGSKKARDRQVQRGKLLVRNRLNKLIDPDSQFLEFSTLAAYGLYDNQIPCSGIVTGIDTVHGQDVVIVANDATVKGGTYYPVTAKKHLRAQEIAEQNHLTFIYLKDSGAASIPQQEYSESLYCADKLYGVVPRNNKEQYRSREIIARSIDPRDTRQILGRGLRASANAPIGQMDFGIFRM